MNDETETTTETAVTPAKKRTHVVGKKVLRIVEAKP